MQPILLSIIGKPLAGKDTQADLLVAAHPEAVKISTGHIMRAVREEGETHRFWPLIGPYIPLMEQGLKLPDAPTIAMLDAVIKEQLAEGKRMLVIAGSPRGMEQLEGFEKIAKETGTKLVLVHMDATDEETYKRSATRNEGRVDDTPEVHKIRLQEYEGYVGPMVDALARENRLIWVNGMQPVEGVFRELQQQLRQHVLDPEITLPAMARR
ncbi:nucleoside monophosphate kinase [Patescibacteria group bacterium]|nr:nucleoside monophosphate kinase [Patescibacteria group bacterium]